jgi:hypothetical protein
MSLLIEGIENLTLVVNLHITMNCARLRNQCPVLQPSSDQISYILASSEMDYPASADLPLIRVEQYVLLIDRSGLKSPRCPSSAAREWK